MCLGVNGIKKIKGITEKPIGEEIIIKKSE